LKPEQRREAGPLHVEAGRGQDGFRRETARGETVGLRLELCRRASIKIG